MAQYIDNMELMVSSWPTCKNVFDYDKEEEFIGIVPASSIKYVNEFESRVSLSLLNKSFRCIIEI